MYRVLNSSQDAFSTKSTINPQEHMSPGFSALKKILLKPTGIPTRLRSRVNAAFNKHLFITNVVISLTLSGAGDVLQQQYNIAAEKQKSWDAARTRHITCSGMTVGALCHHWYKLLDQKLPGRTVKVVAKKLLVDQLLFSPVCLVFFLVSLGFFKGGDFEDLVTDLREKSWRLYAAEWVIWPPAQVINFYWLPTKYRVLYDNTISLMYDVYTSHVCYDLETKKPVNDDCSNDAEKDS
ncbi:mpv17-like protein 2 isoform X1 [Palaemon carinicauda]|uniref:mpv17-like protein 2 isoform X1 n=2 Tax=Palaemon carinicauda TaxID=392227 RepID=UPI0035B5AE56